jgi:hypothetical protein
MIQFIEDLSKTLEGLTGKYEKLFQGITVIPSQRNYVK